MAERLIYLVRHGETEGESSVRYHGRNDVPLSDVGRTQVRRLIPELRSYRFAAVLHSPLSRASESASILISGFKHPPHLIVEHPGLLEVDFGEMEGLTKEEVEERLPEWYVEWQAGRATGFPGGETYDDFQVRIARAWDDILRGHPNGDLLVVAHRGVVKRALVHALGLSAEAGAKLVIELGSLTILRCGETTELIQLDHVPAGE